MVIIYRKQGTSLFLLFLFGSFGLISSHSGYVIFGAHVPPVSKSVVPQDIIEVKEIFYQTFSLEEYSFFNSDDFLLVNVFHGEWQTNLKRKQMD